MAKLTGFFVAAVFLYVSLNHVKHDFENLLDIFSHKSKVEVLSETKNNSNLLKTLDNMDINNVANQDENPQRISDINTNTIENTKNQLAYLL